MTEELQALSDDELLRRLSDAVQAIPSISEGDAEACRRAWDPVFKLTDEARRRPALAPKPTPLEP